VGRCAKQSVRGCNHSGRWIVDGSLGVRGLVRLREGLRCESAGR
jgi:hypothetical protein